MPQSKPLSPSGKGASALSGPVSFGILSRVSTDGQVEKTSLSEQESQARALAERFARDKGITLREYAVYRDAGVSGDGREREALTRALDDVQTGKIKYLFMYDVDRLSRDVAQGMAAQKVFAACRAQFYFCQTPLEWSDATGDLTQGSSLIFMVKLWQGKGERLQTAERTGRARKTIADSGRQPYRGRPPFGYGIYQNWEAKAGRCCPDELGTYYIVPELAPVVVDIYERAARRETLRGIAKALQAAGVPSPSGASLWYPQVVHKIVTDEVYKGVAYCDRRERRKDETRLAVGKKQDYAVYRPREQWTPLPCPATVTPELWQAANDAVATNKTFRPATGNHDYLLTGFLRCPVCGASMSARGNQGSRNQPYYVCCRDETKRAGSPNGEACTMKYVRLSAIEQRFATALGVAVNAPQVIESAVRTYIGTLAAEARGEVVSKDRERLAAQRGKLERELRGIRRAIADAYADDEAADVSGFKADQADVSRQLAEVDATLLALPEPVKLSDRLPEPAQAAARVSAWLARVPEALQSPVMTVAEKRWLLDSVILRAEPIEAGKLPRNGVDWHCRVTLKPEVWGGQIPPSVSQLYNPHADEPILVL